MIFRDYLGTLIEINRLDFKNDKSYYNKIIQIKNPRLFYEFNKNTIINNKTDINLNYSNYLINKIIN